MRGVARLLVWALALAGIVVLAAAVVVPRLAGATPYAVLSGSMSPAYPVGTLVVVRPVPAGEIGVGDVITYQLRSGEPTVVTHRVVTAGVSTTTGEPVFRTQGDANAAPDPDPVRPVQVRGRLWYSLPELGHAHTLLSRQHRERAVQVVALGLLAYAAFVLARGERRSTA